MFYAIWKPLWLTSFQAIAILKSHLGIKKIGHTGTLDPLATWLLIAATDKDTKRIPEFEWLDKSYTYEIRLDGTSPTDDAEWPIALSNTWESRKEVMTHNRIQSLIDAHILWDIQQTPTKYSAIKVNGKRAYELVRKDADFIMPPRDVTIHSHTLDSVSLPSLMLSCQVSKWTYVRTLSSDLCKLLECDGYVDALTRTAVWEIRVSPDDTWDQVEILTRKRIERFLGDWEIPTHMIFKEISV